MRHALCLWFSRSFLRVFLTCSLTIAALTVPSVTTVGYAEDVVAVPDNSSGGWSSIVLDAAGNPVVSYYDETNDDLKVLHCGNPNCTSGNTIAAPDTAGDVGLHTSLALDSAGNPVVSYYDVSNGDLKVLHCGNPTCTAENTIAAPDTAGDVGQYTSLALDDAGHPVVSYYDATNQDLRLLRCGNPTCTVGNTIVSPDTTGVLVGRYTSLVLTSAGNPVVSYSAAPLPEPDDTPIARLRILFCGEPTCIVDTTIRSRGNPYVAWTSLELDADERPTIAYTADLNVHLDKCLDTTCTGVGTSVILGPTMNESLHTSLELDALGNPVISFTHFREVRSLKVIRCGDDSCLAGSTISTPVPEGVAPTAPALVLDSAGNPVVSYNGLNVLHCDDHGCLPVVVSDSFDRTATNSWGGAETGGAYALYSSRSDYAVVAGEGVMRLPAAGRTRRSILTDVLVQNVDLTFRVTTDRAPEVLGGGSGAFAYFIARRQENGAEYRGRLRFAPNGNVYLLATFSNNGEQPGETALQAEVLVPHVKHGADQFIWLRAQVFGTNPTTVRLKAWMDGQREPGTWSYTATDNHWALQQAGTVGLQAYISLPAANAPMTFRFDNLQVFNAGP